MVDCGMTLQVPASVHKAVAGAQARGVMRANDRNTYRRFVSLPQPKRPRGRVTFQLGVEVLQARISSSDLEGH